MKESKSGLRGFAKLHTIKGWPGIDLKTFLIDVQPSVMSFLSRNRQTKVSFTATCIMERSLTGDTSEIPFI